MYAAVSGRKNYSYQPNDIFNNQLEDCALDGYASRLDENPRRVARILREYALSLPEDE